MVYVCLAPVHWLCRKSIDWVENTIKTEGIDCKFERVDGYLFPFTDSPVEWLKLENELPAAHDVRQTLCICKLSGLMRLVSTHRMGNLLLRSYSRNRSLPG